jgi:hypothetical protein
MVKTFSPRVLAWLTASAAATMVASPAQSQVLGWSKTDAILGGTPSALQAIVAQQNGLPVPAASAVRAASYEPAPSSYPTIVPAIYRARPAVSPAVASGRPDVFGSVALKVGNTRLDEKWRRVEAAGIDGPSGRFARALSGAPSSSGSRRSTGTSTSALPSSRTGSAGAAPTSGRRRPRRCAAARATARIMRSPSCRCSAARASPIATSTWWW